MRNSVLRGLCVLALGAGLGACADQEPEASASSLPSLPPWPSAAPASGVAVPSDPGDGGGFSLADALPSPTPDRTMPSMPPLASGSFLMYEDFEKSLDAWKTVGTSPTGVGWHRLKAATCGGLFTMVLGEAKNPPTRFATNTAYLVRKQPIDLRKAKHAQLRFDVKGDVGPPGAALIVAEGRKPGGTWVAIAPEATARFPLVATFNADLAPFIGGQLELRFRGTTQQTAHPAKGFYLDDIVVVEPSR